jgi:hypothetical protein
VLRASKATRARGSAHRSGPVSRARHPPWPSGHCVACELDDAVARPTLAMVRQRGLDGLPRGACGDCGARIMLTGQALDDGVCKMCRKKAAALVAVQAAKEAKRRNGGRVPSKPRTVRSARRDGPERRARGAGGRAILGALGSRSDAARAVGGHRPGVGRACCCDRLRRCQWLAHRVPRVVDSGRRRPNWSSPRSMKGGAPRRAEHPMNCVGSGFRLR